VIGPYEGPIYVTWKEIDWTSSDGYVSQWHKPLEEPQKTLTQFLGQLNLEMPLPLETGPSVIRHFQYYLLVHRTHLLALTRKKSSHISYSLNTILQKKEYFWLDQ
jgi:hypothetical protein